MSKNRNYKIIDENTYEFSRGGGAHGPKFVVRLERDPNCSRSEFVEYGLLILDKTIQETEHMREKSSTKSGTKSRAKFGKICYDLTEHVDEFTFAGTSAGTSAATSTSTSPAVSPTSPLPSKKWGFECPEPRRRCRSRSLSFECPEPRGRRCRSRSLSVSNIPKSMIKVLKLTAIITLIFCIFAVFFCGLMYFFFYFSESAVNDITIQRLRNGVRQSLRILGK